jgi:UDP-N-acetylglucosamine acyltransferase
LSRIHPYAVVSPLAQIGQNVEIGAFCVIEENVIIADGCSLASHVVVKAGTRLGPDNRVYEHAVLGGLPQHASPKEAPGELELGARNTIREFVTMHRSLHMQGVTRVGSDNLLMAGAHVGHDSNVGSRVILTNNVLLAGHVTVEDRANLSGGAAVHQFCRIGRLAMVGGHARIKKDVPPFVMVDDATSMIVGLNFIGLRRNGFTSEHIQQLKDAYRLIFRRGLPWSEVVPALKKEFSAEPAAELHRFLSGGTRGFTPERRAPANATVRLHREDDDEQTLRRKAG